MLGNTKLWSQAGFYHRNSIFQRYIDVPLTALLEAGVATPPQLRMVVSETISACIAAADVSTSNIPADVSHYLGADISSAAASEVSRFPDADIGDAAAADLIRSSEADVSSAAGGARPGNRAESAAADVMPSRCDADKGAHKVIWLQQLLPRDAALLTAVKPATACKLADCSRWHQTNCFIVIGAGVQQAHSRMRPAGMRTWAGERQAEFLEGAACMPCWRSLSSWPWTPGAVLTALLHTSASALVGCMLQQQMLPSSLTDCSQAGFACSTSHRLQLFCTRHTTGVKEERCMTFANDEIQELMHAHLHQVDAQRPGA